MESKPEIPLSRLNKVKRFSIRKQVSSLEQMIGRQQMKIDYYEEAVMQATTHFNVDIEKKFSARW